MIRFIGDHRDVYWGEPICRVLPIAPSTYPTDAVRRAYPSKALGRARRAAALRGIIQRVFEENLLVYGVCKV